MSAEQEANAQEGKKMPTPDLGTILLVEDDENDSLLLRRAFEAEVANPIEYVSDGVHAVAYLSGEALSPTVNYGDRQRYPVPVLILLDLKMPQMGGLEVLRWLRLRHELKRLPVVVLTESADSFSINAAYELGANSYLVKPGHREDIVTVVKLIRDYWIGLNEPPRLALKNEAA